MQEEEGEPAVHSGEEGMPHILAPDYQESGNGPENQAETGNGPVYIRGRGIAWDELGSPGILVLDELHYLDGDKPAMSLAGPSGSNWTVTKPWDDDDFRAVKRFGSISGWDADWAVKHQAVIAVCQPDPKDDDLAYMRNAPD